MMNKYLIEIYLPACGKSFQLRVPRDVPLAQWLPLAARLLERQSGGLFVSGASTVLCDRQTGDIYDINRTARELGFQNGSAALLI